MNNIQVTKIVKNAHQLEKAMNLIEQAINELDHKDINCGYTDKHEDRDCKTNLIQSLNCQSRELKQALVRLNA